MLFGIPRAKAAKAVPVKMKDRLRRILSNVCGGFKFEFSWAEFARVHTRVEESAAHWRSWACLSSYRQKVGSHPYEKVAAATDVSEGSGTDGLPNNLDSFIVILNIHIETYFRYALPLTYIKCEKELRFFKSLVCKRTEEFVRETRCQASGVPGKSLWRSETTTCFSLDGRLRRVEKELYGKKEVDKPPKE